MCSSAGARRWTSRPCPPALHLGGAINVCVGIVRVNRLQLRIGETVSAFAMRSLCSRSRSSCLLTGSAIYLAASAALFTVPHLLFGLLIGAWTDRTKLAAADDRDRRLNMAAVGSVPVAASPACWAW
jgi:hypothetical protein